MRNYPYFLSFLLTATSFTAYVCAFCVVQLVLSTKQQLRAAGEAAAAGRAMAGAADDAFAAFLRAVSKSPLALLIAVYTLAVAILLCMLGAYHLYLISVNETTNENVRVQGG
jgi:hypothetical protein